MALNRKSGTSEIAATPKRRLTGAWVTPATVKRRLSGAWVTVWAAAMSLSASPASLTKSSITGGSQSGTVTCNVSGGVGPFTYSWTWAVGGTGITINNPTLATTNFTSSGVVPSEKTGTARCTVTDTGNGNVTAFVDVTIDFIWGQA